MSRKNPPVIEIYSMVKEPDGSSIIHTRFDHGDAEPDFYDVVVRYEEDDPLAEVEDLKTFAEAYQAAKNLQTIYVGAEIEEIVG